MRSACAIIKYIFFRPNLNDETVFYMVSQLNNFTDGSKVDKNYKRILIYLQIIVSQS